MASEEAWLSTMTRSKSLSAANPRLDLLIDRTDYDIVST
jgi:hypothetical protein